MPDDATELFVEYDLVEQDGSTKRLQAKLDGSVDLVEILAHHFDNGASLQELRLVIHGEERRLVVDVFAEEKGQPLNSQGDRLYGESDQHHERRLFGRVAIVIEKK